VIHARLTTHTYITPTLFIYSALITAIKLKKSGMPCDVHEFSLLSDLEYVTFMLNDFCVCLSTCYSFIYSHHIWECNKQLKIYAAQNGRMIVNNELEMMWKGVFLISVKVQFA
jgi:hypothetical protein